MTGTRPPARPAGRAGLLYALPFLALAALVQPVEAEAASFAAAAAKAKAIGLGGSTLAPARPAEPQGRDEIAEILRRFGGLDRPPGNLGPETRLKGELIHRGRSATYVPRPPRDPRRSGRVAAPEASGAGIALFNTPAVQLARLPLRQRWDDVSAKAGDDLALLDDCLADGTRCKTDGARTWADIVLAAGKLSPGERIAHVNRAVNSLVAYRSDRETWHRAEYWASPAESLARGRGDCEDYVILKYWTLRRLGVSDDAMRIVVLRDRSKNVNHAVLAVAFNSDWLVLDNRYANIRFHGEMPNYQPIYSFNFSGQWAHLDSAIHPDVPIALGSKTRMR